MKKLIILLMMGICSVQFTKAQPKIALDSISSGFNAPVDFAHAGDERLFIVEQRGTIQIMDTTGKVSSGFFLDIRQQVTTTGSEQGLLGLAFHPDFSSNGYFYINYTTTGDSTHISRYSVSQSDPGKADPNSEKVLFSLAQPYRNHNGGGVKFGPDGYLYLSLGDGGSGGNPGNRAQDSSVLLGKILRVDVDTGDPYGIPPDNPFKGISGARDEIWAMGLRNPWRFSFDSKNGNLWIADVGQNDWEEINREPGNSNGGLNYGWRCYEGDHPYNTSGCGQRSKYRFPVHEYPNMGYPGECSVTGGLVYRGSRFPGLQGQYLFADYCSGKLWSLYYDTAAMKWDTLLHGEYTSLRPSSFGEDAAGEAYICSHSKGIIYRLINTGSTGTGKPFKKPSYKIYPNPSEGTVNIHISNPDKFHTLQITGTSGKVTYTRKVNNQKVITVSKESLKPGLYLVTLLGERTCRGKFVIK